MRKAPMYSGAGSMGTVETSIAIQAPCHNSRLADKPHSSPVNGQQHEC